MRLMKVTLAVTALFLLCGVTFAQADWRWQRDNDHDGYSGRQNTKNQKQYQHGLRDGQNDRSQHRAAHPRHNDRAYLDGYRAGYGQGVYDRRDRRDHDRDADNGRGRTGPYGQQQNVQSAAYNNGFQEGLRYGQADRGHHSYRMTNSDTYKHGTAGYMSSYGDKNAYKQGFQQGFRAGYDRGYYGR